MKTALSILFAAGALLTFSACCKKKTIQHDLPEAIEDVIPYKPGEQIVFAGVGTADTLRLNATIDTGYFDKSCAECFCQSDLFEYRYVSLVLDNPILSRTLVNVWADAQFGDFFQVELAYPDISVLTVGMSRPDNHWYCSGNLNCVGTMQWGSEVYDDVLLITQPPQPGITFVDSLWYNPTKGLLGFHISDGKAFRLAEN